MLRSLLVSLVAVLALPAAALAADDSTSGGHKDRTTEIMIGLIFVLMLAMVLIGVGRLRRPRGGRRRVQA